MIVYDTTLRTKGKAEKFCRGIQNEKAVFDMQRIKRRFFSGAICKQVVFVNASPKLSIFAEKKCHFSPDSTQ